MSVSTNARCDIMKRYTLKQVLFNMYLSVTS